MECRSIKRSDDSITLVYVACAESEIAHSESQMYDSGTEGRTCRVLNLKLCCPAAQIIEGGSSGL